MSNQSQMWTAGFHEFMENASYGIQQEVELWGAPNLSVSYKPTDWSKDDPKGQGAMADWSEEWGTCPKCNYVKSANGACEC
jgi:hypothetical protein